MALCGELALEEAMVNGPTVRLTVEWRSAVYTDTCFCVSLI